MESGLRYRIGLDVGTASVGLVAVSLDEQGSPGSVVYSDLRIFSEPTLPAKGVGELKKANRRRARLARRGVDRKARRYKRVAFLAPLMGIDSYGSKPEMSQRIHELRVRALSERIELEELLRVCSLLAKRRGYAGGFKSVKSEDAEAGEVKAGIATLKAKMKELDMVTLGQYLLWRLENGKSLKLKNDPEAHIYADRGLIKEEFGLIMAEQRRHHPILDESFEDFGANSSVANSPKKPLHKIIEDAVFFQRPLKSIAGAVGRCSLEPTVPRAPKAQPANQRFRIEKQIADLRWGANKNAQLLTEEQKSAIRAMLADPKLITLEGSVSFEKIYKRLDELGLRPEENIYFNMHRAQGRKGLMGDRTRKAFSELGVLDLWDALSPVQQVQTINFLSDMGSPEACTIQDWHVQLRPKLQDPVVDFINTIVDSGNFGRLSGMKLETGRASYSIKALERLTTYMSETGADEYSAVESRYPTPPPTGELSFRLSAPKPTGNIIVDGSLRMIQRAVNGCVDALGVAPEQVIVELARDLPLGLKRRQEIIDKQAKNEKMRIGAREEIRAHGMEPTGRLVHRYLLWKELEDRCPYCERRLSLEDALDSGRSQVDHILPRSLTQVGRQRDQQVLCHSACNGEKNGRTPFEAFGHDSDRWQYVVEAAKILEKAKKSRKAHLLTLQEYEGETVSDATIEDFAKRQFAETSWIAKETLAWLKELCTTVSVTKGSLTAALRRHWKLETVIPEVRLADGLDLLDEDGKPITEDEFARFRRHWEGHRGDDVPIPEQDRRIDKRIDHRHHLIDALVVVQTDLSLYQRMAREYKREMELKQGGDPSIRPSILDGAEPPIRDLNQVARDLVRNTPINRKPDRYVSGKLFAETAYRLEEQAGGKAYLSLHVPLIGLTDAQGSLDKARKRIEDIVSDRTRQIVRDEFEKRLASGQSVKEALSKPIQHPDYGNPITGVQTFYRNGPRRADGSKAIGVPLRNPIKRYISDGNAYVAVWSDGSKFNSKTISITEARQDPGLPKDGVRFFYTDDLVRKNGDETVYRICQIKEGGTVCLALATETRIWADCIKALATKPLAKTVSSAKELNQYEVVN